MQSRWRSDLPRAIQANDVSIDVCKPARKQEGLLVAHVKAE